MAMLCSLGALSIDSILPALLNIQREFELTNPNHIQLVIGLFFLGLGFGSPFFGPLADSIGRKKAMVVGLSLFLIGNVIALFSNEIFTLLVARFIQGFGASSTRIIVHTIIRDKFSGRVMAKMNSLVASIFIMVPVVAPFIGQGILLFFHWKVLFIAFILISLIILFWFLSRQAETLKPKNKIPFQFSRIKNATIECIKEPQSFGYALAGGFIYSILLIYLVLCPQILKEIYGVGDKFPIYFALVAIAMGIASVINSKLVMKYGMIALSNRFLSLILFSSSLFFIYLVLSQKNPDLWLFMAYVMVIFFSLGMIFSNFLALCLQKVGHIAGVASSIVTSMGIIISFLISLIVGQFYSGSVNLVIVSFFATTLMAKIVVWIFTKKINHSK